MCLTRISLEEPTKRRWNNAIVELIRCGSTTDTNVWLRQSEEIALAVLPAHIIDCVRNVSTGQIVGIHLTGVPENLNEQLKCCEHWRYGITGIVLCGVGQIFGEVFGLKEDGGHVVQNVRPQRRKEKTDSVSAVTNRSAIGFHLDAEILEHIGMGLMPHGLGLIGVRNRHAAPTRFLLVDDIVRQLDGDTLAILGQERFMLTLPEQLRVHCPKLRPVSVLRRCKTGGFALFTSPGTFVGVDAIAETAAARFQRAVDCVLEEAQNIVIGPGELVLWSQHRLLHGRPEFNGERWLQRIYLARSLDRLQAIAGNTKVQRVFDADFMFRQNT